MERTPWLLNRNASDASLTPTRLPGLESEVSESAETVVKSQGDRQLTMDQSRILHVVCSRRHRECMERVKVLLRAR